jgi:pimeloyl-ACP methyl ester carboxylesterase
MPTATLNGTTLHYEEAGAGEPLVLVHGAWSDHTMWDLVVPGLAESLHVVTYDLRGHGRSELDPPDAGTVHDDVADLVALIDHLGLAPANVAGISSGACIALRLAVEHPDRVRRVLPHEPPSAEHLLDDPGSAAMLAEFGATLAVVQEQIAAGETVGAARRFFGDLVRVPFDELPPANRRTALAHAVPFLGQLRDPDAIALDADGLRTLTVPVLLSEGVASHPIAIRIVDRLARCMPHAERIVMDGVGHVPPMTHPEAYVGMVTRFMASTAPAREPTA